MANIVKKLSLAVAGASVFLTKVSSAMAFEGGDIKDVDPGVIDAKTLDEFVQNALTVAVSVGAVVAVVFIIVNGIKYITSTGDPGKTEEAQKGIIAALIGLIVIGVAYLVVRFVLTRILGIDDPGSLDSALFIV